MAQSAWKKYLRDDPTRFLLDANAPPSIHLWYALDIANRPEDAPAVVELRDRVLYSDTVQAIFAAQHPDGYWDNAASLTEPRYRATIWNLALLAELGIPRTSRRARNGIEFVFARIIDEGAQVESQVLTHFLRAANYFNLAFDPRVKFLASQFAQRLDTSSSFDSALALLATFGRWQSESSRRVDFAAHNALDIVLDQLARRAESAPLTFPHFNTDDDLFILRVLAEHHRANDPRAERALMRLVAKQDAHARWVVETGLNDQLIAPFPDASDGSYWMTLNAVRIIKSIVVG